MVVTPRLRPLRQRALFEEQIEQHNVAFSRRFRRFLTVALPTFCLHFAIIFRLVLLRCYTSLFKFVILVNNEGTYMKKKNVFAITIIKCITSKAQLPTVYSRKSDFYR